MARRSALALARPPSVRLSFSTSARRTLVVVAAVVGALALAYVGARLTPIFAVRDIEVSGAPTGVAASVSSAAQPVLGTSLVALDGDELVRRLEALPSVRAARYDRAFPNTLRIFVVPERPLAVVRQGVTAWVVSERGRVIRRGDLRAGRRLPQVSHPSGDRLSPGTTIAAEATLVGLGALAAVPSRFPMRVLAVQVLEGDITLVLSGDAELRLGGPADVRLKLAIAARVLRSLRAEGRARLAYLDVSLPERPVAADKSQVES